MDKEFRSTIMESKLEMTQQSLEERCHLEMAELQLEGGEPLIMIGMEELMLTKSCSLIRN